jgi:hypothetical protein
MSLKVIGTGFGRTGTDSMRTALEILGFGPCHHMRVVIADDQMKRDWRALATDSPPDWDRLFGDCISCMDWPSARYWPQLVQDFPEARVILTHRSAESWWTSFAKTILPLLMDDAGPLAEPGADMIKAQVFGGRPDDRTHAIATYKANVARVMAKVPANRLLVHELGDGWEPLCAHLGVPVPDQPYPSANTTTAFRAEVFKDDPARN